MSTGDSQALATPALDCRVCGSPLPIAFLDLGCQPLANAYAPAGVVLPTVPLAVTRCPSCTMLQLTHTVEPNAMFLDYAYKSSVSTTWVAHCADYIDSLFASKTLSTGSTVVEVASNDGYLLRHLASRGARAIGVEPAVNLAAAANDDGLRTINEFMGTATAPAIYAETGPADLVIANNVLAHVPDPVDFLRGIASIMGSRALLTIESPHALRLVQGMQFDTVYHEHVFYLTVRAVQQLAQRAGLELVSVVPIETHGGSLRMTMSLSGATAVDDSVSRVLAEEDDSALLTDAGLSAFASKVANLRDTVLGQIRSTVRDGAQWAGFGAAAKGVVFVNYLALDREDMAFVVDNNPLKQGRVLPGTNIPIRPVRDLSAPEITDVLLLAWNIANELRDEVQRSREVPTQCWAAIPRLRKV